jgi:hypothetical protein
MLIWEKSKKFCRKYFTKNPLHMAAEQVIFKNVGRSFNQTPQMPSLWSDSNGIGLWRWQFFLECGIF